jgi:MoaA/NifB/PqqE/SkfB family radical SAM enzyme
MGKEPVELSAYEEFYFQWHITERCNRSCTHCYQNGRPAAELPLDKLLEIAGKMDEASAKWGRMGTISLTGGEPFIRGTELYGLAACFDPISQSSHCERRL